MAPDDTMLLPLAIAWVALLGATIGSFLNVVIARVPAGLSIVRPRSRCPRCEAPIAWYDNLPVVSWLVLRGRCRACRGPISIRYPLVEGAVAAIAVAAFLRHGFSAQALGELVAVSILLAAALIDLDTWLLPHALTWSLVAVGLVLGVTGSGPSPGFGSSALGAAIGWLALGAIWFLGEKVLHREAMGLGDAFLLAGIGAWLGLPALLPVVLLASLQGSVVGIAQLLLGKGQPGPAVAPPPGDVPAAPTPEQISPAAGDADPEATPASGTLPAPAQEPAPGAPPSAPDAVPAGEEALPEWTPPRHSVPFGPFLAAGAVEWLYLSGWLAGHVSALELFR